MSYEPEDEYIKTERVKYVAVDSDNSCEGCAFRGEVGCQASPPCSPKTRKDGRDIIWFKDSA